MREPTTLAEAFEAACILDAPLNARLEAYARNVRLLDHAVAEAYDEIVARITSGEAGSAAPRIGERMPLFVLPSGSGHLVRLDELIARGPVVLTFNRGHWCSFCRMHLRALSAAHAELGRLGARVVSIMPDRQQFLESLRLETGHQIEVLSDIDNAYALSLGLVIWLGDRLEALMRRNGHDLELIHGAKGWLVPLPATFILDTDGYVRGRSVESDFRRRMGVPEILAVLMGLGRG